MLKIEKGVWKLVDITMLATIISMVALIALQVGSRLLGSSIAWTEELSRFLFIWTAWLGMAVGFRHGQHPSLNILTALLSKRAQTILQFLPPLCAAVFFAIISWYGIELLRQQVRVGEVSAILELGMWFTTLPIVIGSGLAILGAWMHALNIKPREQHPSAEQGDTV